MSKYEQENPIKTTLTDEILKELKIDNYDIDKLNTLKYESREKDVFPKMNNDIIIKLFNNKEIERIPLSLYYPTSIITSDSYKKFQESQYFDLLQNPFETCEITLQIFNTSKPDLITIYSDFLILLKAMGKKCEIDSKKGGYCPDALEKPSDISTLTKIDIRSATLSNFYDSIFLTRMALKGNAFLSGFCCSAFTLLCYLVEKKPTKIYESTKKWLYCYSEATEELLTFLNDTLFIHLCEQIKSGAQIVNIMDFNANVIDNEDYQKFSLKYNIDLGKRIKEKFPGFKIIFYVKGQSGNNNLIFDEKSRFFDCISVDFNINNDEIKNLTIKNNVILQGNLDPQVLLGDSKTIENKTQKMLNKFKENKFIANLGAEIMKETEIKSVQIFVETVRNFNLK